MRISGTAQILEYLQRDYSLVIGNRTGPAELIDIAENCLHYFLR